MIHILIRFKGKNIKYIEEYIKDCLIVYCFRNCNKKNIFIKVVAKNSQFSY